jgi:YbgC/YbaW family acyl-CoA thioester hydrolase
MSSKFKLHHRLRVRWAEVDPQGIVFNGHYLTYFDVAMTEYWRGVGLPYAALVERFKGDLFVRKTSLEYHDSARFDDLLTISARCERMGHSSLAFTFAIARQDSLLVEGELVYVFADTAARQPLAVPDDLRELINAFESGKPMFEVRVGDWLTLGDDSRQVRTEVFIDEQKIPPEMEWDDADHGCVHAVAYNRLGTPVATGRLLEHVPGVAKIGRMAAVQAVRGSGVGRRVLDALMQTARERGDREALLHAQVSASGFYAGAGFMARGSEFDEVGIPHVEMVRAL